MYSAFILGSIVEVLVHYRYDVPVKVEHACGVLAFAIEGFLFYFHLHSREPMDIHVHILLVIAIAGNVNQLTPTITTKRVQNSQLITFILYRLCLYWTPRVL